MSSIYFMSVERREFFFSTDRYQKLSSTSFVSIEDCVHTHQNIREDLIEAGYEEINNPAPEFSVQTIHALSLPLQTSIVEVKG